MASHALKQVRIRVYFPFKDPNNLFFSTGHFTRHRATGANECATCHAQPQHTRRALGFHSLDLGKDCVRPQGSPSHWSSSLEDPGAGPRNKGHSRYGFTGAGSPRHRCHASCVCLPPPRELLTWVWVSNNSRQATSYVSATTVGCSCHLLCRSNPGEYPENRRGPQEGSLRIFPSQLFGTSSAVAPGRARRGSRERRNKRVRRAGQQNQRDFLNKKANSIVPPGH